MEAKSLAELLTCVTLGKEKKRRRREQITSGSAAPVMSRAVNLQQQQLDFFF